MSLPEILTRLVRGGLTLVALAGVAACSSGPSAPVRSGPAATMVETLARPVSAETFEQKEPYRIGPFDTLSYTVRDIEGLNGEIQVDGGGDIQVPVAGTVRAAGRTTSELAALIAQQLRAAYVRNPQVAVNLVRMQSQFVTVDGSVGQPGVYPMMPDMTLTKAVASARGLSDRASTKRVIVQRQIGGQTYLAIHDLSAIRMGSYPDPQIYPNDVVVVGESRSRQIWRDILQILPSFAGPLYLLVNGS